MPIPCSFLLRINSECIVIVMSCAG
jgi:hypothetical protein